MSTCKYEDRSEGSEAGRRELSMAIFSCNKSRMSQSRGIAGFDEERGAVGDRSHLYVTFGG